MFWFILNLSLYGWSWKIDTHLCKYYITAQKRQIWTLQERFLPIRLWRHGIYGTRVLCHSAAAQSHQICSVHHLCVITYSPTWLPQHLLKGVSSHLLFIPPLQMGYQFFVFTDTATSRAGSRVQFVSALWVSLVPYPLASLHFLWPGLCTVFFCTWRRCPAFLRTGESP